MDMIFSGFLDIEYKGVNCIIVSISCKKFHECVSVCVIFIYDSSALLIVLIYSVYIQNCIFQ